MGVPFEPTDVTSGYNLNKINENFDNAELAFEKTLNREGGDDNEMEADLDMNSNDILNANNVSVNGNIIYKGDVLSFGNSDSLDPADVKAAYELNDDTNALTDVEKLGLTIHFKTDADLIANVNVDADFEDGEVFSVVETGCTFVKADAAATDHHRTTAGGVKLYLQPDQSGRYNALGMGAVADGVDNFGGVSHGFNALTGVAFYGKDVWAESTAYAVGDRITHYGGIPTTQPWVRYYTANTAHTSTSDFATDISNWTEISPWIWTTGVTYEVGDIVFEETAKRGYVCTTEHTSGASLAADTANWEAGAFSGTDNSAVMDDCITHFHEKGLPVFWGGTFLFDTPSYSVVAGGNAVHNFIDCDNVDISGEKGTTKFLINETADRLVTTVAQSFWLDSRQETTVPTPRNAHKRVSFRGIDFIGRWSHAAGGSADDTNGMGLCPLRFEGFEVEEIEDCGFYSIRNKAFRNSNNGSVKHTNLHGKWCGRGFIRSTNASNVISYGHVFMHGADDSIDYNLDETESQNTSTDVLLSNFLVTDGESIQCSGGRNVRISDGITNRSKGAALQVPRAGSSSLGSGLGPKIGVSITNVIANDPFMNYEYDTGFAAQDISNGAIGLSGNKRNVISGVTWAGDYNSTDDEFKAPWEKDEATITTSPMWSSRGLTEAQTSGMFNRISNVSVLRTLPDVTKYSHWGFGPMFTREGPVNPAVDGDNYNGSGLSLLFDLADTHVDGFTAFGLHNGVYFNASNSNRKSDAFRSILFTNTNIKAMADTPVYFEPPTEAVTWTVTFDGGVIDSDPYFKDAKRTTGNIDGTWSSTTSSSKNQKGFFVDSDISGVVIKNFHFRNVYRPFENTSGEDTNIIAQNNYQYCQPLVTGSNNASNKGIRFPLAASAGWKYVYEDSDPQSATFGTVLNTCPEYSDAIPTSGWFPKGHFVNNTDPSISSGKVLMGWSRLTDGSAHVVDTDWAAVYMTNS